MTQIGRIPHSELTGSHIGPRKPRDTLDWLSTLQLSPSFSYFLVSNMELGTQIEMESQNHGQTACWSVRGIKGANAILFNWCSVIHQVSCCPETGMGVAPGGLMGQGMAHSFMKNLRCFSILFLPVRLRKLHWLETVHGYEDDASVEMRFCLFSCWTLSMVLLVDTLIGLILSPAGQPWCLLVEFEENKSIQAAGFSPKCPIIGMTLWVENDSWGLKLKKKKRPKRASSSCWNNESQIEIDPLSGSSFKLVSSHLPPSLRWL